MYIFISHSSKDATIAAELCNLIESNGSQCFLAPRNIRSGFEYAAEIVNGIDNSDAMLLLLSENANSSPHILREIERAVSKSIPIIVYKLEEVTLSKSFEYFLMTHQWLNAEYGSHEQLLKCIEDMKNNTSTAIPTSGVVCSSAKRRSKLSVYVAVASTVILVLLSSLIIIATLTRNDKDGEEASSTSLVAQNTTTNSDTPNQTTQDSFESTSETTTVANEEVTSETTTDTTSETTTENYENDRTDIKLGDTVVFGRYNDADIYWKVIKISEDGKEAVLIARELLTFKGFSPAESGRCYYDGDKSYMSSDLELLENDLELQTRVRGNSSWKTSTIRAWLNSNKYTVDYVGQVPVASGMSDRKNGYNSEPGFLYNFSTEELSAIKDATIKTKGNALFKGETITTTDKVFLLSIDELKWLEEANVPLYTTPTPEAIEQNQSTWYHEVCLNYYYTDTCLWWLRDPVEDKSSEAYVVSFGSRTENLYYPYIVAVEDFGIRPAITVDLTSDCIKIEK